MLAEGRKGIRYASKEWGLEDLAIDFKGLEPAMLMAC